MKDLRLIRYWEPCWTDLSDPAVQSVENARARGPTRCPYYDNRSECWSSRFRCIQLAGVKVARYVLEFYAEASERTLAMEMEEFRRRAPLPPNQVESYVDTRDYLYRRITDPDVVVQRVWAYASAVLDLRPDERIFRSSVDLTPPEASVEPERVRDERVETAPAGLR